MRLFVVASIIGLAIAATAVAGVSPNSRLIRAPERDGAVFSSIWLRGEAVYQNWDNADVFELRPTFALPLLDEQVELGARWGLRHVNPDRGDSETGLTNIDLWGKFQVLDAPLLLSVGGIVTLPVGSDDVERDVFRLGAFGATRYYVNSDFALIGNVSLRHNADLNGADGKIQFGLGGGLIYQVIPELNITGELNLETKQFDNFDNYIAVTGGVEYLLADNLSLQGGLTVGLDDDAPDFELIGGVNFKF